MKEGSEFRCAGLRETGFDDRVYQPLAGKASGNNCPGTHASRRLTLPVKIGHIRSIAHRVRGLAGHFGWEASMADFLRSRALGVASMLLLCRMLGAQQLTGSISGRVAAKGGRPVAGATCYLDSEATGAEREVGTDTR